MKNLIKVQDRLPRILENIKVKFKDSNQIEKMIYCEGEEINEFCYKDGTPTLRQVTHWQPFGDTHSRYSDKKQGH